jgi:hypothetical protein
MRTSPYTEPWIVMTSSCPCYYCAERSGLLNYTGYLLFVNNPGTNRTEARPRTPPSPFEEQKDFASIRYYLICLLGWDGRESHLKLLTIQRELMTYGRGGYGNGKKYLRHAASCLCLCLAYLIPLLGRRCYSSATKAST